MFKSKDEYEEYLYRNKIDTTDLDTDNYFEHSENGEIIINKKDYKISSLDVERYTNCINWILLKDQKTMALLKRPFGDIYRNLNKEQYEIALYNNILLPQVARQFQNKSAMYYIVGGKRNHTKTILTIDFKNSNEELVHGEEILQETSGNINELNIKNIIREIEEYLKQRGFRNQDIDTIKKEFIKQSLYNRFVKQTDENNHNWGVLINNQDKKAQLAPIYDVDCCCEIGTLRKHIRETDNGSKVSMKGLFEDFGQHKWFNTYVEEILEEFDIDKAIKDAKRCTGIDIPANLKNYYKTFFGERYYTFKSEYQEYLNDKENNETKENQVR